MPIQKSNDYPKIMAKLQSEEDLSFSEFNTLKDQAFHSNIQDTIYSIGISQDPQIASQVRDIPLTKPIAMTHFVDFTFSGYCSKIAFEELRKYMVKKKLIEENAIDADFYAYVWLNVSFNKSKTRIKTNKQ